MIYLFFVISLFSFNTFASRNVPLEYVNSIENKLPNNYAKFFKISDTNSPEYTVVAHELTMDLLFIAEEARKTGNLYMSFNFLRLAHFLFPHRGDVSKKFQSIAEQITMYLNSASVPCNDYYEYFLRDLKAAFPAMISQINAQKCEQINKAVRDINADIVALEKRATDEGAKRSLAIQANLKKYIGKSELSSAETKDMLSQLVKGYLGHIEFKSKDIYFADERIVVDLELIRKYSAISYDGMISTYQSLTNETFENNDRFYKAPLSFQLRFIQNDKITTYPVSIKIKNPRFFDIWLRSINLFVFPGYPIDQIAAANDMYAMEFHTKDIKINFYKSANLNMLMNRLEIHNVPNGIIESLKKIDLIQVD